MTDKEDSLLNSEPEDLQEPSAELEIAPEQELQAEPALDEVSEKAKKFGHLSKEDWIAQGRDPNKWKSPDQFVKYGDEYSEVKDMLKSLRTELKTKQSQIDELITYHKRNAEDAVKKAKAELEGQLQLAKESGNLSAVENLTQQKMLMEFQQRQESEMKRAQEMQRVDIDFMERNKHWFNDSRPDLKMKAQQVAQEIMNLYPNISYDDVAKKTEARIKFEHPEIDTGRSAAPQISASRSAVNKSAAAGLPSSDAKLYQSLTAEQRIEFEAIKNMVEKVNTSPLGKGLKPVSYTVKEYLNKANKR